MLRTLQLAHAKNPEALHAWVSRAVLASHNCGPHVGGFCSGFLSTPAKTGYSIFETHPSTDALAGFAVLMLCCALKVCKANRRARPWVAEVFEGEVSLAKFHFSESAPNPGAKAILVGSGSFWFH